MSSRMIKCNNMRTLHIMSKWRMCTLHMKNMKPHHLQSHDPNMREREYLPTSLLKMLIVRLFLHLRRGTFYL